MERDDFDHDIERELASKRLWRELGVDLEEIDDE
jgi:hypothetical protein